MSGVLADILARKREDVAAAKREADVAELRDRAAAAEAPRGFAQALARRVEQGQLAVIAEIKRRSPSAGALRPDDDVAARAKSYEQGGAACLSVLTDAPFFGGSAADLQEARAAVPLPVLRKDFIIDAWQVHETRALGADCMLLIAAALPPDLLAELAGLGRELGLDVLVEVHAEEELEAARRAEASLVGINNRDLRSMTIDLAVTERLAPLLAADGRLLVAESGVATAADAARARAAGAGALLVGEALMRAEEPAALLADLASA
ncbi:MAG: indole-3-glycerol phosphate synthase TrpC [Betaproteobacteria bacterium AqS2]|uniref:Indole-3-glycerol phosphate synthase n=1 Tax=Candidatus Amphirhobacter heronislandensis TaxID=1732024 RepID=A0A930UFR4_9GAMM|nr:indole-3-glycerol phosphate synthase TrpC [Betaproteobacteria bacterium AqS2]